MTIKPHNMLSTERTTALCMLCAVVMDELAALRAHHQLFSVPSYRAKELKL